MVFNGFLQYAGISFSLMTLLYSAWPVLKRPRKGILNAPQFRSKAAVGAFIAAVSLAVTLLARAPGCPGVKFSPAGDAVSQELRNCTAGIHGFIDRKVFGELHLPLDPACKYVYGCTCFTKYGILGLLNFCFGVYLGMSTGEYFLDTKQFNKRIRFLTVKMVVCFSVASVSSFFFERWSRGFVPVIKGMWTFSYVMLANFFTCALFLFLYTVHEKKITKGWPFRAVGLNAIFIYTLYSIVGDRFPFGFKNKGSHMMMILSNLMGLTVWILLSLGLHKYRFYIKY